MSTHGTGRGGGALLPGLSAVSRQVSNIEVENLSERLALLGFSLLSGEAVANTVVDTTGRGVVKTGQVKRVLGEGLASRLGTLLSHDEGGVLLSKLPDNTGWNHRRLHNYEFVSKVGA